MIGPGFWKINSPNFFNENIFSQTRASLTGRNLDLNLLKLDKNFLNSALSSKDLFNKEIAVAWSENILKKAKNDFQIPRIFFSQLPDDLYTYELKNRKKLFITIMLPLLVRGNEIVSSERKKIKLLFYRQKYEQLKNYCSKYKVSIKICSINQPISMKKVNSLKKSLLTKVDIFPLSMMLAQAAIESGWGMSRFAKKGNALFGQWTWDKSKGLKPNQSPNANFVVKSFKNLQHSVNSYILNLNTHPAYEKMRKYRKLMKDSDQTVKGTNIAKYLDKYAEIGYDYVLKVISMIESNKFEKYNELIFEVKK